jgi:drug/metabolite transporter (DMT)-like permease
MALHFWAVTEAAATKARGDARSDGMGYAAGLAGWLLAGSVFVAVKAVSNEMPPWTMCLLRSLISAIVLLPIALRYRHEMMQFLRERWLEAWIVGVIGLGLTQGVMFTALGLTSAVNAGIVFALAPMITLVAAHIVLREDMTGWQGIGSAIAFIGVLVISVHGSLHRLLGFQFGVGELVALGSAFLFAAYTVSLKRAKFKLPPIPLLVILLFAGSSGSLPFALWEQWSGEHSDLTIKGYLALFYCGIIGGSLLYLLYNWSVEVLGASRAGTLVYTQPLFVALFAWLILGEAIEWYHYVGAGLVAVGVLFVTMLRPRPAPQHA